MDTASKHTNEKLYQRIVSEEDPHVVGLMGIHIMDVLAGELSSEEYSKLMEESMQAALAILHSQQGQQQHAEANTQQNQP